MTARRTTLDSITDIAVIGVVLACLALLLGGVYGYRAEAGEAVLTMRDMQALNRALVLSAEEPAVPIAVNLLPPAKGAKGAAKAPEKLTEKAGEKAGAPKVSAKPKAPDRVDDTLWSRILVAWKPLYALYKKPDHPCEDHRAIFDRAQKLTGLPAALLGGVASVESRCQTVSGGWMQIQEVDPASLRKSKQLLGAGGDFSPRTNPLHAVVSGGIILKDLERAIRHMDGAMIAYNVGIGRYTSISDGGARTYGQLRSRLPSRVRDHFPVSLAHALLLSRKWAGEPLEAVPGEALKERLRGWLR